jgi:RNA polymerase sigma-70 factor (ECF subfamily)
LEKQFIQVITEHQGIILKVCRMYCSDREDSKDLFQEIVLQLWKSYPKFNGTAKISTWMYRLALNIAITRLRKNSRRPGTSPLGDQHLEFPDQKSQRIDIEYGHELQLAIDSLNKFDKALMLLYLDEKSYKEMAEIMELSETNVGVKIGRIKQKLKEKLKP